MRLRVSLLGEQSVTEEPAGIVLTRTSRTTALIAHLALHAGTAQTRQQIAGRFWPDSTDAQALTNLRRELHTLRRVLGDAACLEATTKDLRWRDAADLTVDVRVFRTEGAAAWTAARAGDTSAVLRHGAAALEQYRGEFLPGAYDDWVLDARAELQRQCVELCDLVSETRVRAGDLTGALPVARQRIRQAPLEESGYRVLMRIQADLGDRAGAVSTYHRCAALLEHELGIAPDAETRRVLQRVMTPRRPAEGQPETPEAAEAAGTGDPPITETTETDARTGRARLAQAGLVGRSDELGQLRALWSTTSAGHPNLVVVRGGVGVGKTRLVAEISDLARQHGAVVATSQCFGTSGRLALAPVADWLRTPDLLAAAATLPPLWRQEVERLVPLTGARAEPAVSSRAMVDSWQRHRFFEGLARAVLAVERPTLLVLDNLQWCDPESLAFLTFLLGLVDGAPILVATTLRADLPTDSSDVAAWIVRMRASGMLTELALDPLDALDAVRLAEMICGRPLAGDERHLLEAAGGFPLHVVEAMRAAANAGSRSLLADDLGAVLRSRLEQASPTARDVAGLAAAVGRDFALDLLTEASDLDDDSVVRAVDELWRRRILQERGDTYDFAHELLREAAYLQVSPPKRWLLHRRIAQGLELLHAEDPGPVASQLAQQYARGGRPERAVTYYERAAEMASGVFAHAEAVRLHAQSLAIIRARPGGPESDRRELAVLEAMAAPLNAREGYSSPRLQEVLERSIALAERLGRKDSLMSGLVGLWASQYVQGRMAESHRTAARAIAVVDAASGLQGAVHFAYGGSALAVGRPAEAVEHLERAARLSGDATLSIGTRPDIHGRAWAAHAHWLLGDDGRALAVGREVLANARALDHPYSVAVALAYVAVTYQLVGDLTALRETVAELGELCDRYGFGYYPEWGVVLSGWCRGDAEGLERARRGVDRLKADGSFARMPYWLALIADLQVRIGAPGDARSTLDAAAAAAHAQADLWWLPEVERMRAALEERPDRAEARLQAAAAMAAAQGSLALLRRCERDLLARGRTPSQPAVRTPG